LKPLKLAYSLKRCDAHYERHEFKECVEVLKKVLKIDPNHFRANRKNPNAQLSQQAIKYRLNHNMHLPEVLKYNKVGKVHVLTVDVNF
jgi:hypothetical protein